MGSGGVGDHGPLDPARERLRSGVGFEVRRLGDLMACGKFAYLRDRERNARELDDHADLVLYRAVRDALPPVRSPRAQWRSDLVEYPGGTLPNGEPNRSMGHWNPDSQVEVFEVISGQVSILYTQRRSPAVVFEARCTPGSTCLVPPGGWHLTYVLDGPALVFNLYSEPGPADGGAPLPEDKYSRRPPPSVTMCLDPARAEARVEADGPHAVVRSTVDASKTLLPAGSLTELVGRPQLDQLDDLARRVHVANGTG